MAARYDVPRGGFITMSYLALFACDRERCRCGIEDPRDNQTVWAVSANGPILGIRFVKI